MYAIELEVPISNETVVNVIPVCNSCKKRTWVSGQRMKPQSIHNHPDYLISSVNNAHIWTSRQPTQAMTMERRMPIPCNFEDRSASHICARAWSNDSIAQSLLIDQAPDLQFLRPTLQRVLTSNLDLDACKEELDLLTR